MVLPSPNRKIAKKKGGKPNQKKAIDAHADMYNIISGDAQIMRSTETRTMSGASLNHQIMPNSATNKQMNYQS